MNSEIKDVYVDLDTSELDELLKAEEIKYYLFVENDIINGRGCCKRAEENILNYEVSKEVYDNFEKYVYQNGELVLNPNYEAEQIEAKKEQFNKDFFLTSLGYIRRKVTMKTGETKDFLSDLLPVISMGVQSGQAVTIIAYKEPDFTTDVVDWESLQEVKTVTAEFVQECFMRLSSDFTG